MYNFNKVLRENLINSEVVVPTTLYLEAGVINMILLDAEICISKLCGTDPDISVLQEKFDLDGTKNEIIGKIVEWFKNHYADKLTTLSSCKDDDEALIYNEANRLYAILFDDTYSLECGDLSILIGEDVKEDEEKVVKAELCGFYEAIIKGLISACTPQTQQPQPQQPQTQEQAQPFIYYNEYDYVPRIVNLNFEIPDSVKVHDISEEVELSNMLNRISAKLKMDEVFIITNYISPYQFEAVKVGPDNLPIPKTDIGYKSILVKGAHDIEITTKKVKKRRNK